MKTKSLIYVNRFNKISITSWLVRYSEICDISDSYFGADFPFNIELYDNMWVVVILSNL
jgi:hypothetical protein